MLQLTIASSNGNLCHAQAQAQVEFADADP